MKHIMILLSLLLAACNFPISQAAITLAPPILPPPTVDAFQNTREAGQTQNAAVMRTYAAKLTATKTASIGKPTATKAPTSMPTATTSVEEVQAEVASILTDVLLGLEDVDEVNLVRLGEGLVDIELRAKWASRDAQPDVSYKAIQALATVFGMLIENQGLSVEKLFQLVDSDSFAIHLLSYSADGDYPYESTTDLETLLKVFNRSISHDEWVTASGAGFR